MAVGIGVDRHRVRRQFVERLLEGRVDRIAAQIGGQFDRRPVDETGNVESRIVVIGERMAAAHIAEPGDHDAQRTVGHLTAPAVMPRMSWREKITYRTRTGSMASDSADRTAFQLVTN